MLEKLKGKRLLLMSGNMATIELIERCHEFGIIVYVTDYLENSPGKKFADKSFMVSTNDIDAVVDLCRREKVDGVLTINIDFLLPYYAAVCEKLHFPCYGTMENFMITIDKLLFKENCRNNNVPSIIEYSLDEVKGNQQLFPVIVKPVDSSSSRGISVSHNLEEFKKSIEYALEYSKSKKYIIEKYMEGTEAVLYYYFQNNNPVFMGMCDRYAGGEMDLRNKKIPTCYIFPSRYTDNHLKKSDHLFKKMFISMGMTNGPIFLQCFIDNGIPHVYESGYRLNGAREHYLFGEILGINSADMLINYALTGEMAEYDIDSKSDPYLHGKYACILSPILSKGRIRQIEGVEKAKNHPNVIKLLIMNDVGMEITEERVGTLPTLAYRAYIVSNNLKELKETILFVQENIKYYNEKNELMPMEFFDISNLDNYFQCKKDYYD